MRFLNLLKSNKTQIEFMRFRKLSYALSILLITISVVLINFRGLNYGIDFAGGVLIEAEIKDASTSQLRKMFKNKAKEVQIQNIEDDIFLIRVSSDNQYINIKSDVLLNQSRYIKIIQDSLSKEFDKVDYRKIDYVGPQIGSELILKGVMALIFSFVAIMFYIWLRFDWQFGVGGILAIIHDAILVLGFYCVTQIEFNLTSIAAVLTVIGYSINDSVVIFDRIRDNMRRLKKSKMLHVVDISLNSTLRRTILTSFTTLLSLSALLIFGGSVLQSFSAGAFFGVLVGVYSSIYVAAPVLVNIDPRKNKKDSN